MRSLATQLSKIPTATPTVDDLRAAGRWAELFEISAAIDSAFAAANFSAGDQLAAATLADFLVLHMVIRELPPNRPTALRLLTIPSVQPTCSACQDAACRGNRLEDAGSGAYRIVLEHHKTRRITREAIRVDVPASTTTSKLLTDYLARRRALLLKTDTDALFISPRTGDAYSERAFGDWVPRLLAELGLGHLSFTSVRALAPLALARLPLAHDRRPAAPHCRRRCCRIRWPRRYRR